MSRPITRLEKILRILYLMFTNTVHPTNLSESDSFKEDSNEPSIFYPSVYASPTSSPRMPESPEMEIGSQLGTSPS